jgi:hypothetical protein
MPPNQAKITLSLEVKLTARVQIALKIEENNIY